MLSPMDHLLSRSEPGCLPTHTHTHTEPGMLKYDGNLQQAVGDISLSPQLVTSPLCVKCVFVGVSNHS